MCKYKLPDFGSRVLISVFLLLLFSDSEARLMLFFVGVGGDFKVRKIYSINCLFGDVGVCKQ